MLIPRRPLWAARVVLMAAASAFVSAASAAQEAASPEIRSAIEQKLFQYRWKEPQLRLEMGPIARPPQHEALHSKDAPPQTEDQRTLNIPVAPLVSVAVVRGEQIEEMYLARLVAGAPELENFAPDPSTLLPFTVADWQKIAPEFAPFYQTALDISRGSERFDPFLPADTPARAMFEAAARRKIGPPEMRRLMMLGLDVLFHRVWLEFEQRSRPPDEPLQDAPPARRFEAGVAYAEKELREMRQQLRALGALSPKHVTQCLPYVRRYAGEALVLRTQVSVAIAKNPSSVEAYYVPVISYPRLYLTFARLGGKLQLVDFALD